MNNDFSIEAYELLSKVKTITYLENPSNWHFPYEKYSTVEMVADYYEVTKEAVQRVYQRNAKKFHSLGALKLKGGKLNVFKSVNKIDIDKQTGTLVLFSSQCVLETSNLIKRSEIATKLREIILETGNSILIKSLLCANSFYSKQNNLKKVCIWQVQNALNGN